MVNAGEFKLGRLGHAEFGHRNPAFHADKLLHIHQNNMRATTNAAAIIRRSAIGRRAQAFARIRLQQLAGKQFRSGNQQQ